MPKHLPVLALFVINYEFCKRENSRANFARWVHIQAAAICSLLRKIKA